MQQSYQLLELLKLLQTTGFHSLLIKDQRDSIKLVKISSQIYACYLNTLTKQSKQNCHRINQNSTQNINAPINYLHIDFFMIGFGWRTIACWSQCFQPLTFQRPTCSFRIVINNYNPSSIFLIYFSKRFVVYKIEIGISFFMHNSI